MHFHELILCIWCNSPACKFRDYRSFRFPASDPPLLRVCVRRTYARTPPRARVHASVSAPYVCALEFAQLPITNHTISESGGMPESAFSFSSPPLIAARNESDFHTEPPNSLPDANYRGVRLPSIMSTIFPVVVPALLLLPVCSSSFLIPSFNPLFTATRGLSQNRHARNKVTSVSRRETMPRAFYDHDGDARLRGDCWCYQSFDTHRLSSTAAVASFGVRPYDLYLRISQSMMLRVG